MTVLDLAGLAEQWLDGWNILPGKMSQGFAALLERVQRETREVDCQIIAGLHFVGQTAPDVPMTPEGLERLRSRIIAALRQQEAG